MPAMLSCFRQPGATQRSQMGEHRANILTAGCNLAQLAQHMDAKYLLHIFGQGSSNGLLQQL